MNQTEINIGSTQHALTRMSQRGLRIGDVEYIKKYGRKIHNGGAVFIFLGKNDIPNEHKRDDRCTKLEGSILILSNDEKCIITMYKNRKGLTQIKKKEKRLIPHKKAA